MAKIFDEILLKGIRAGQVPARSSSARKWFREKAQEAGKVTESQILRGDRSRLKNRTAIGKMYFFIYDPKHKATLPYYDQFPLIFPVGKAEGGFYGLNMHYLPLELRAELMDALYETTNNDRYDESTKLKISYSILKSAENMNIFKPTFKRYLSSHVRSRFVEVLPSEWDIALWLNSDQFVGAGRRTVWSDSKNIIAGKKPRKR